MSKYGDKRKVIVLFMGISEKIVAIPEPVLDLILVQIFRYGKRDACVNLCVCVFVCSHFNMF